IEAIALSLDTKPAGAAAPRNGDKVWITPRTTRT
ncbi:MAG: hypothetical protein QOD51_1532, partial [Candidatus Eremiobacteraeota bacterium]|nr:hypothetical protein [Candidatus Eremiobacteraeota bacterium]